MSAESVEQLETAPARARSVALDAHRKCAAFYAGFRTVSQAGLASLPSSAVLVDVRTPAELAVSRIQGSLLPDEFERVHGSSEATVVAVCTVGLRAGLWAQGLARSGYGGDICVSEGILLHVLDGGEVVRRIGDGEEWEAVKELHTYEERFSGLPSGWQSVSFSRLMAVWEGLSWIPAAVKSAVYSSILS